MNEISVKTLDTLRYEVIVDSATTTIHIVVVKPDYAEKLTSGRMTTAELVHRSFEFLLEREPNSSILRSFDLSVIPRYFPEYEQAMSH